MGGGGGWFSYIITFVVGLFVNSGILWLTARMLLDEERRPGLPTCAVCVISLNFSMVFAVIMAFIPTLIVGIAIGFLSPALSAILTVGIILSIMAMVGRRVISSVLDVDAAPGRIILIVYLVMSFGINTVVNLVTGVDKTGFGDSEFEEIAMSGDAERQYEFEEDPELEMEERAQAAAAGIRPGHPLR